MDKTDTVNKWYDIFLEALSEKYPQKVQLVQALMDLLSIERESVYRRLRKDVAFHILEIVKISSEWNISLDRITGLKMQQVPFMMQKVDYLNSSEQELSYLQNIIYSINELKDTSDTEFMYICNKLPRQLYAGFDALYKFHLFKWKYQYSNETSTPFAQIEISENNRILTAAYYQAIKEVPSSNFILDRMLFEYIMHDIRYFQSIRLITREDIVLIKNDLHNLLDYLHEVAAKGCYPETRNKVTLYVSQLNIDTNYSYVYTQDVKICFVQVFDKYEIYSFDLEMVENFKTWMQRKKKMSTQISEVDEKSRFEFFDKQRQLVDEL